MPRRIRSSGWVRSSGSEAPGGSPGVSSAPVRDAGAALAGAFLAAALPTAPAFRELQGLTGRESIIAVAAFTLAAFCLAFALTGVLSARALGITGIGARGVAACAAGGVAGGAFAILPFCWAWMRLDVPGESYLVMTLAIVGFLGSLIAPFHVGGTRAGPGQTREGPCARVTLPHTLRH